MTMSPNRWATVERLYHAALARPVDERAAFLAEACAGEEDLRREVEALLAQPASVAFERAALVAVADLVTDVGYSALVGRRIGSYHIVAPIGAGGMGEVYRARDMRLGRDVAIKILPRAFTADADRLARFEREARVLASLNHPHIAAIHGVEDTLVDGGAPVRALILELVDGETLAERIARAGTKGVPVAEALGIAQQIADALDAAHEKGIVHRDLKPANIKITPQGVAKVLDFGLAKLEVVEAGEQFTQAPTLTGNDTREGLVMGTAAYMSPEQARGQTVDKRTDIWAFGCVVYEMLTGHAAFARDTVSDTLAAVLEREPVLNALPTATPQNIRRLLERCFVKDQKRRLRDIGDARVELEESLSEGRVTPQPASTATPTATRARSIRALATIALALAVLSGLVFIAAVFVGRNALDTRAYRFVPLAAEPVDESSPSWSPDGKSIVYVAEAGSVRQLFTRSLDSAVSTQVTRSEADCLMPFWSHDGARIYYISGNDLWSVGATGGEPQRVMEDIAAAALAPDGRTLAFLRGPGGNRALWIANNVGADQPMRYQTPPFPETFGLSTSLEFSPDGSKIGVLIRRQEGTAYTGELWILPQPTGTPRRVLERIPDPASSRLSWSPDNRQIVWDSAFADRPGVHLYVADTERSTFHQITSGTASEQSPAFSPDGDRIAFATGNDDFDLVSVPVDGSRVQTLLASARSETRPTWSPNGVQLAYVTNARGTSEIWLRSVQEGWARPIVTRDPDGPVQWNGLSRPSFSPDGQRIVYEVWSTKHAIWVASIADGRGVPLDQESPDQHSPAWSPDGKWITYQRLIGGRWELVKVPSGGGNPVRLGEATPGGGDHTAWSPRGDWIAHVRGGALRLTSATGDGAEKTLDGAPPPAFGFSGDGSSLYAVRHASNGAWSLVMFAVQSGRQIKATNLELPSTAAITGFSFHPDGKSFATAVGIPRHDIWLLEGFKRP